MDDASPMAARSVWCLGMYASASTWLFNVARQMLSLAVPVRTEFVYREADTAALDRPEVTHLIKSHDTPDDRLVAELDRRVEKILVTVRDPRDAVASLMLYHRHDFATALALVEASARLCRRFADDDRALLLTYESRFYDVPEVLPPVAAHLGLRLEPDAAQRIFADSRRVAVEARIAALAHKPGVLVDPETGDRLDPETHWHSHHAGRSGEIGRWRRQLAPEQGREVERRLAGCFSFSAPDPPEK